VKVEWQPEAESDLDAILAYSAERSPAAASRLTETLVVAADSLSTSPNRGRLGSALVTRELVITPPYLLVHEVEGAADTVRILRVRHGARER